MQFRSRPNLCSPRALAALGVVRRDSSTHSRGNWTFFGSDRGGKTAAVLLSFIATCKRNMVEPFAWFRDVLTRLAAHPIQRIEEPFPHNWNTSPSPLTPEIRRPSFCAPATSTVVRETLTKRLTRFFESFLAPSCVKERVLTAAKRFALQI